MSTANLKLLCSSLNKLRIDYMAIRLKHVNPPPKYRPPYWHSDKQERISNAMLTNENEEFLNEVLQDKLNSQKNLESPLCNVIQQTEAKWHPKVRRTGLIVRKIGNYPLWTKTGKKVQTTLLQVADNHVIKYTPPQEFQQTRPEARYRSRRPHGCLLVGAETIDPGTVKKEYCGLFNAVGMLPKRILGRFFVSPQAVLPTGTPLLATHFRVGDYVDVRGKTIDRGFQGVMKRWGFHGMPASHGVTKTHRRPGNIGSGGTKARVMPGTKMPGHMGNSWRIIRGCRILRINTQHNVLWVMGVGIPGETGSFCYMYDTILPLKKLKTPPPFPTQPQDENVPLEYYDELIHPFEGPSIMYNES